MLERSSSPLPDKLPDKVLKLLQVSSSFKDSQTAYAKAIAPTYRALAGILNQQGRKAEAQRVLDLLNEP